MLADAVMKVIRPISQPGIRKMSLEVQAVLDQIPVDFGGGCSLSKACALAELIRHYNLRTTVDIGVYRGRSLFPQALAHARYSGGLVYGVDPWSALTAQEHDNANIKDQLQSWLTTTDFEAIYQDVIRLMNKLGLANHCLLVRQPSADAITFFRQKDIYFDLIHIDGNHDTEVVMADLRAYMARLRRNGFVVLDDISWDSVRPAYDRLQASMQLLYQQTDPLNDYAIFWRGKSAIGRATRRLILKAVAREGTGT